jgi:hypothetical protein
MPKIEIARAASADMLGLSRRGALAAFATYALLSEAHAQPRTSAALWVNRQDEIARALRAGQITPLAWQGDVETLAREVDLAELVALVNGACHSLAPHSSENDPIKRHVRFLDANGEPRRLAYGAALFAFEPRNVITPHGHRHMVSAHMVVDGAFRIRNFDRIGDEGEAMLIRPTRDYIARVGEVSTMSSQRDNIHWFVPQGGAATTFDVIISDLTPGAASYEIRAIDPLGGQRRPNGAILAPIMSFEDSSRRYTADV